MAALEVYFFDLPKRVEEPRWFPVIPVPRKEGGHVLKIVSLWSDMESIGRKTKDCAMKEVQRIHDLSDTRVEALARIGPTGWVEMEFYWLGEEPTELFESETACAEWGSW